MSGRKCKKCGKFRALIDFKISESRCSSDGERHKTRRPICVFCDEPEIEDDYTNPNYNTNNQLYKSSAKILICTEGTLGVIL